MWPKFGAAFSVAIRPEFMLSAAKRKLSVAITTFTLDLTTLLLQQLENTQPWEAVSLAQARYRHYSAFI